jgi:type VI protein secretion system component VasF
MNKISETEGLERLCNPLLLAICNYWQLACIDSAVELEPFGRDISSLLEEARRRAALDETLSREFAVIEKPLVFFIDYMVREGRFPFRNEWRIMARSYNELSGDEKFFDLLEDTLQYPDTKNSAALFFIMLGLGFDGIHRKNQAYIQHCMYSCMQKAAADFDVLSNPLVPDTQKKRSIFTRRRRLNIRFALIVSAVFMVICFLFNLVTFIQTTSGYREILTKTVQDSVQNPETSYLTTSEAAE